MVRGVRGSFCRGRGSPHTRGDGPLILLSVKEVKLFSPHAWGWSAAQAQNMQQRAVLPTRVGMVRRITTSSRASHRSPHTRGDGPATHLTG